jgi:hypothetical protein
MSEQTKTVEPTPEQKETQQVLQTIAGAVTQSLNALNTRNDAANAALMGLTIILGAMPETAQLRPERVAAVMGVVMGKNNAMQQEVANFVTGIVNMAGEIPKAMAAVAAQYEADQARSAGAKLN